LVKKKGLAEKMDQDDEELLENKEMFMSVKDFDERRVVIPEFGRKKKGAEAVPEVETEEEEPEEAEGEEEVSEEEGDTEEEEGEEGDEGSEDEDDAKLCNRECYQFNAKLSPELDDKCCKHCKLYLTLQCPHIKEFMDEVDEGDVD
jgi:cobalamin biosynthesis protein CobT